jgi:3-dehydroquinate synthase
LEDRLFELGADRDSAILAVGGGVTGDLAGFVAATWHRGIPVVQVPTSLLAMVDAAIGGKTAVNLGSAKNLVGAFHQPLAVWVDVRVLDTLPQERLVEGYAEVVKSAAVRSAKLFRWLEQNVEALLSREPAALEHAVTACITIKGRIVARDEREAGPRAALNFGHTIGHALEAETGYALFHGQAVAVGLCAEGRIAQHTLGFPTGQLARLERLLERFGLPLRPPSGVTLAGVLEATRRDKKVRDGRVRYALPVQLGRMPRQVTTEVDDAIVETVWRSLTS